MPQKAITDGFVRTVKPPLATAKLRQVSYFDKLERGLSLVLVVSFGGAKTFRALTYIGGKPKSVKLGSHPQMTVAAARKAAREYWENPEKFKPKSAEDSFGAVAANWLKRSIAGRGVVTEPEIRRLLDRHVLPRWASRNIHEFRRKDATLLLDHVSDKHGPVVADSVLRVLSALMRWHQARDESYVSPVVPGMRRSSTKARDRTLDDDEIRQLWKACGEAGVFGSLLKVCLLTGQRSRVVAAMRWLDLDGDVWTVRSDPRARGNIGRVRLPQMCLDIIQSLPRIAGSDFVFSVGRNAFASWGKSKSTLDSRLTIAPWTIHDLRRTHRTLVEKLHVPVHVVEAVLGHKLAGVRGIYNRFGYLDEKAEALLTLANLIQSIVDPTAETNVVPFRG